MIAMAFAFDSLGYAKKLRDAGVAQDQAEAHSEAAREFIMTELATRSDLDVLRRELETAILATRNDFDILRRELDGKLENIALRLDAQTLRLTVRMGVMLAAGLSIL